MCKNELNKQPDYLQISPWLMLGRSWRKEDYLENGILRIPDTDGRRCQELHNASHAAWILYMNCFDIIREKSHRITARRTNRIIAHLSCLREFVCEEKNARYLMVLNRLIKTLKKRFPRDYFSWARFIVEHWPLIRAFAGRYGYDTQCLSEAYYEEVCRCFNRIVSTQKKRGDSREEKSPNTGC